MSLRRRHYLKEGRRVSWPAKERSQMTEMYHDLDYVIRELVVARATLRTALRGGVTKKQRDKILGMNIEAPMGSLSSVYRTVGDLYNRWEEGWDDSYLEAEG